MRLSSSLPAGVAALLFDSAARLRRLEGLLVAELERARFGEAILPVVDYLAPYEPLLAPAARAELHRFADRDGELLALRADFTPMLARLLAPHLDTLPLPLRAFYRGDVVRAGAAARGGFGRGHETEQYHLGGELVGTSVDGTALEREAARLFARLLAVATGGRGRLVLGLAGALDELLVDSVGAAAAPELARAVARRERGAARAASPALLEVVESGRPAYSGALGAAGALALERLAALRTEIVDAEPSLAVSIDLAEFADFARVGAEEMPAHDVDAAARDLRSYYGGLVMRGYLPGVARAVASGGRYDELFRRSAGGRRDVAAAGFSLRLEPLAVAFGSAGEAAGSAELAEVAAR